jgi:Putative Flp pilus-assembly TadE/G-like
MTAGPIRSGSCAERKKWVPMRTDRQSGQAMPFVVLIMVMVGLSCVALLRLSHAATDAARARTAADAAALAGARDGIDGARRLATANGGALIEFRDLDEVTVEVVVQVGQARAVATAELAVAVPTGPP